ncbi:tyrosine-type recombinase/integrase [Acidobacteriota bacterium]
MKRPSTKLLSLASQAGLSGGKTGIRLPAVITEAGHKAERRFLEFFTAHIRNPNTRQAYGQAVVQFLKWCHDRGLELAQLEPMLVAAYIEKLTKDRSPSTVKQHLAAIRMLFDYLVLGQVLPFNPAAAVRGPKYVVKKGKTPVLNEQEARGLLESIDTSHVVGLRDRAFIGVMVYSFARVGAVVQMRVKDYYRQGLRAWFVLHEKGGKFHKVPAHRKASEFVEAYIEAAGIADEKNAPLFRSTRTKTRVLTDRPLNRVNARQMVRRRAKDAGLPPEINCHTFRATGITNYLEHGGTIEIAAQIAGHESTRTTQLYNRTDDKLELEEIEKVRI